MLSTSGPVFQNIPSADQSHSQQQQQQIAKDGQLEQLVGASRTIDERLVRDDRASPELADLLLSSTSSEYTTIPSPLWSPFVQRAVVNLPESLLDESLLAPGAHPPNAKIIPEIGNVVFTVENRLFLWDYIDGNQLVSYDGLQDFILAADLIKPKPGVFVDDIQYVLVICVPYSVRIMALTFNPSAQQQQASSTTTNTNPSSSKSKIPTMCDVGLSADTRGVFFRVVCGTPDGRIFLGGNDGNLYELEYRAKDTLFSSRCSIVNITGSSILGGFSSGLLFNRTTSSSSSSRDPEHTIEQIVHDSSRNLLYILHASNTIQLFHLGPDGAAKPTSILKYTNAKRDSLSFSPRSTPALDNSSFKIVSISIVSSKESRNIGLVATTSTAVRIYFTLQHGGMRAFASNTSGLPSTFGISHIRFPPTNTIPSATQSASNTFDHRANMFHSHHHHHHPQHVQQQASFDSQRPLVNIITGAHRPAGFYLAANGNPAEALCAVPEASRIVSGIHNNQRPSLVETTMRLEVPGKARVVTEDIYTNNTSPSDSFSMNELATQMTLPRREFLVLTENGITFLARNRPLDVLIRLFEGGSSRDQEVRLFFESYGYDESLAMCLAIASGLAEPPPVDSRHSYSYSLSRHIPPEVINTAKRYMTELGGRPTLQGLGLASAPSSTALASSTSGGTTSATQGKVQYSFRHDGLSSTFARLVRPIWKQKVTVLDSSSSTTPKRQKSNISADKLGAVQKNLLCLQSFFESQQNILMPGPDQYTDRNALQIEYNSIIALRLLLSQFVESISFVMLLMDFQLPDVVAACSQQQQGDLLSLTYQDLLTTTKGREIARNLVSAMINHQINQGLSVDAISDLLQGRCGSFCSADDVLLYKAAEHLRKAANATDPVDRSSSVRESLRLFIKASAHLTLDKLDAVCTEYQKLGFNHGAVELALHCASEWDKEQEGLTWYENSLQQQQHQQPSSSASPQMSAYDLRLACYKIVFATLEAADTLLDDAYAATPGATTSSTTTNQSQTIAKPSSSLPTVSVEEAEKIRTTARTRALASHDKLFHFNLYEWFSLRGRSQDLLSVQTEFVKPFLLQDPITRERYDLLWQYYAREGSYFEAAQVVAVLAEIIDPNITLNIVERMQYLSMAVTQAKAQSPANVSRADLSAFLNSVEEKRDVAQIQVEIYSEIDKRLDIDENERKQILELLEERLYNISELYSQFAEPYEMYEIQLYIFHVSDHHDPTKVQQLWELVINQAWSGPEGHRLPKLRAKVSELARRFYPSDTVLPLGPLISLLEEHSLSNAGEIESGWVPLAFRDGSVPFDKIFEAFDVLFRMRVPPWQTTPSIAFLAADITVVVEKWYYESRSAEMVGNLDTPIFPVNAFDTVAEQMRDVLERGASASGGNNDMINEARRRLDDLQRRIIREH